MVDGKDQKEMANKHEAMTKDHNAVVKYEVTNYQYIGTCLCCAHLHAPRNLMIVVHLHEKMR